MQLTIRDRVFAIESARLGAGMADPYWSAKWDRGRTPELSLGLEIRASKVDFEDSFWRPMLHHDWLTFPSRDWRDIAGRRLAWSGAEGGETPDASGCMYVFEHAILHESELVFGARDGRSFEVEWRGLCDIFWDTVDYGTRVPFAATARATFESVRLAGSARDDARSFRERLALHLEPDDFEQGPVESGGAYQDGMAMTSCVFTPRA